LEPRKNYPRLLEAYALLRARGVDCPLVIAGSKGWLYEPIFRRLDELALRPHVRFLQPGGLDLIALYSAAAAFVYPALYEGFGLPPLEAMACGAAVACSNTSSLPEAVGDAAITFDPLDVGAIADSVEQILADSALRAELQAKGRKRAGEFSWDATAAKTVAVYREAAGA
jgi:glycosyltransferase involved in cell wall biosynthesis